MLCAQSLSPVWFFVTPWTTAHQAPLSMEFPRQEYWSGLPFPPPGDLPNPGIESESPPSAGRFFTTEEAQIVLCWYTNKEINHRVKNVDSEICPSRYENLVYDKGCISAQGGKMRLFSKINGDNWADTWGQKVESTIQTLDKNIFQTY